MLTEQQYKELIDEHTEINYHGYEIDPDFVKGTPEYQAEWDSQRAKLYALYPKYVRCVKWLETDPQILKPGHERVPAKWEPFMDEWDIVIPMGVVLLAQL